MLPTNRQRGAVNSNDRLDADSAFETRSQQAIGLLHTHVPVVGIQQAIDALVTKFENGDYAGARTPARTRTSCCSTVF